MFVRFLLLSIRISPNYIMPSPSTTNRVTRQSTRIAASGTTLRVESHSTVVQRPKRKRAQLGTDANEDAELGEPISSGEAEVVATGKRSRKKKVILENEDSVKSPRKRRETKPEPVYDIPDVERKETTFKGRLGTSRVQSSQF